VAGTRCGSHGEALATCTASLTASSNNWPRES
jgi:hypothetical protein